MAVPAAKIETPNLPAMIEATTPEERLKVEAARLAEMEAELLAVRDKIRALENVNDLRGASESKRARLAPHTYEQAAEYFTHSPHALVHEMDAAIAAEPKIRARVVEQRGLVARLRQQVAGRQAATLRDEYLDNARRTARALAELEACILAEHDIAERVRRTGMLVSPLPDLAFGLIGTRDQHNSPMAGWFRRASKAGVRP